MNSEIIEKNYQEIMHCHNYLLDPACKFDHNYMTCILCAIPQWHWFPKY